MITSTKEIRRNGYISTCRTARKGHKCSWCGLPIQPREEYYEVVAGGGGLGWLKHPNHCHIDCVSDFLDVWRD